MNNSYSIKIQQKKKKNMLGPGYHKNKEVEKNQIWGHWFGD